MADPSVEKHSLAVCKHVMFSYMCFAVGAEGDEVVPIYLCIAARWALLDEKDGKSWTWPQLRQDLYTNIKPPPQPGARAALDCYDQFEQNLKTVRARAVEQGLDLLEFADGLRDTREIVASAPPPARPPSSAVAPHPVAPTQADKPWWKLWS